MQDLVFQLKQKEPISFAIFIVEEYSVKNLKPAVVKVYDYYNPSKHLHHTHRVGGGGVHA